MSTKSKAKGKPGAKPADADMIVLDEDNASAPLDKCINYQCTSGVDLMTPPYFCLSFYRIRNVSSKNQKICMACFEKAVEHNNKLMDMFMRDENLLDVDHPIKNETVAIEDSDSDNETEVEKEYIDEATLKLVEEHFDEVCEEIMGRFHFEQKIDDMVKDLQCRFDANVKATDEIREELAAARQKVDKMNIAIHNALKPVNVVTETIDIGEIDSGVVLMSNIKPNDLPKEGPFNKPPLKLGQIYFVKHKSTQICPWVRSRLDNVIPTDFANKQPARYVLTRLSNQVRTNTNQFSVVGTELAYSRPCDHMLDVGTRVIALFEDENAHPSKRSSYYAGVVGEFPTKLNHYRYLIFFDDGYANYIHYSNVYMVYETSKHVWEDVHPDSAEFIRKYLSDAQNRPKLMLTTGQVQRTEYRGSWYRAEVHCVDCSLVEMYFPSLKRMEWIYRGSHRFWTLYTDHQSASTRRTQTTPRAGTTKGSSYIQTTIAGPVIVVDDDEVKVSKERAVARKSSQAPRVGAPPPASNNAKPNAPHQPPYDSNQVKPFLPSAAKPERAPGKIVYYTPRKQHPSPRLAGKHTCSEACQSHMTTSLARLKGYGPLAKPLLCGYYRLVYKMKFKQPFIVYKAPCGRSLRNMAELHMYLQISKSQLTVDLFSYDTRVRCLAEFLLEPNKPIMRDISQGVEEMPIPVYNYENTELYDPITYSTKRMPTEGVHLNLDPEFLVCCDCTDDCSDREKCACWQLTMEGVRYFNGPPNSGYAFRRLKEPLFTGIYECNSRCKCKHTCLNRVVQFPLQHKLQLYRTMDRGWGIRCLNDIPEGSFICIYAGSLLTDQSANEGGKKSGDEYLAELDYIENIEEEKEGYEKNAIEPDEDLQEDSDDKNDVDYEEEDETEDGPLVTGSTRNNTQNDSDFVPSTKITNSDTNIRTRLRKRDRKDNNKQGKKQQSDKKQGKTTSTTDDDEAMESSDDDDAREPSSFTPSSRFKSVRTLFGPDEKPYIMDAKYAGNIGRYLNHSCSPNVFVQNVFVDTHDLRFPWVAFFAKEFIRAGCELTWHYNYVIDSVPGKILYCYCGSDECRGRLL